MPGTATNNMSRQSECSEQTTGECRPVLEQFLTIKDSSTSNEEEEEFDDEHENHDPDNDSEDKNMKSDWLKSVQLWNQPDPLFPKEVIILENPYHKLRLIIIQQRSKYLHFVFQEGSHEKMVDKVVKKDESMKKEPMANGGERRKREAEKDGGRKQRRCWSSQLHRRFLNALQHLGGPHGAS